MKLEKSSQQEEFELISTENKNLNDDRATFEWDSKAERKQTCTEIVFGTQMADQNELQKSSSFLQK